MPPQALRNNHNANAPCSIKYFVADEAKDKTAHQSIQLILWSPDPDPGRGGMSQFVVLRRSMREPAFNPRWAPV
jgi:hypothetical protein